jgi:hypothetical protein
MEDQKKKIITHFNRKIADVEDALQLCMMSLKNLKLEMEEKV